MHLRGAMPAGGLLIDRDWKLSPDAFSLSEGTVRILTRLGPALRAFQRAANDLYLASAAGHAPEWVSRLLDQGKPPNVIAAGRCETQRARLPAVIRPDLMLTEAGVSIAELDTVPGGIGLTAWLGRAYAELGPPIIGGPNGMLDGFVRAFPSSDILISPESGDYEPEMRWLAENTGRSVYRTGEITTADLKSKCWYRFFELFDLPNIAGSDQWLRSVIDAETAFSPPIKAFLEEKLWLALFWTPQLEDWWRKALRPDHFELLRQCIPQGWVFDPVKLPPHAVWPGLDVHSWEELKHFGVRARELVLKISGFSPDGWGSRGVFIGHDLSQPAWAEAIDMALARFPQNPFILQRFHRARVVNHPVWDDAAGIVMNMQARVRLCPYYFVPEGTDETVLGGVLATVCPSDKKILHGMKDAMMLPCVVS